MKRLLFIAVLSVSASAAGWLPAAEVDFLTHVKPLLESACVSCHGPEKPKGDLRLDTKAGVFKGSEYGPVLVSGKPSESSLYTSTILPPDHDDIMPPKGAPLTKIQSEVLRQWIEQGASWPDDVVLQAVPRVDFVADIQPILEFSCVACHREGQDKGSLRLDTREFAFTSGDSGPAIIPFEPEQSRFYTSTILPPDHDDLMPPSNKGGPLPREQTDLLRNWILQGASWPEDLVLTPKKVEEVEVAGTNLTAQIHWRIVTNLAMTLTPKMDPYTEIIPGVNVKFEMVPIPPGEFMMGSAPSAPGHKPDEAPPHRVFVDAFWMGKHEVTWNEFELFMYPEDERKRAVMLGAPDPYVDPVADAVSRPTKPYVEMSFGMGKDDYPAISMTQHAANKYCEWLSAKTGHFYRLPTEAEWEYACRAGTTTAFFFGDDAANLGDYAWYARNSNWKYQKVGRKKPNPWGLHDIHGNVVEWTLDQYDPDYYKMFGGIIATNPWNKAVKPYPHAVRGGSWDDENPFMLRSPARRGSDASWKMQDPQLPKSIWYHTDAQWLGFRVVRPLRVPPPEELYKYWTSGVEKE